MFGTTHYSRAVADRDDTLERDMQAQLKDLEQKAEDEISLLDMKYEGGQWNLYDDQDCLRVEWTSRQAWDYIFGLPKREMFERDEAFLYDEWDELHDGNYCDDCGSPMCIGNCWRPDEPLHLRSEVDFADSSEGDSGCIHCGRYLDACVCLDDDNPAAYEEWVMNNELGVLDAQERVELRRSLKNHKKFPHLSLGDAKIAQGRLEDGRYAVGRHPERSSWKRSNRSAQKNWARHARRITKSEVEYSEKERKEALQAFDEAAKLEERIRLLVNARQMLARLHGRGGSVAEWERYKALNTLASLSV